jgi:hypothetical protein
MDMRLMLCKQDQLNVPVWIHQAGLRLLMIIGEQASVNPPIKKPAASTRLISV